jgi:hypothetical protein
MRLSIIALLLCASCFSYEAVQAAEEATAVATNKPRSDQVLEPAPPEDLEQIQGQWTRTERTGLFGRQRVTKEIEGDLETVTYYDSSDEVSSAHTVKVQLRRAGPIKVFLFKDQTFTAGPNKGEKQEGTAAYVYKVVGDTFIEIWGVLDEGDATLRVLRWTRASTDE